MKRYTQIFLAFLLLASTAVSQSWLPNRISTTISAADSWYFAGTNTYMNALNIGGTIGTNGFFILNGVLYSNLSSIVDGYVEEAPIDTSIYGRSNTGWTAIAPFPEAPIDSLTYGRINESWALIPDSGITIEGAIIGDTTLYSYSNITKIGFSQDSGLHVTSNALNEVLVYLGSYWKDLYLGDGHSYSPTGEQPLQIKMNPDTDVTVTTMYTNDPGAAWTLYIPATAGPAGEDGTNGVDGVEGSQGIRGYPGYHFGVYAGAWIDDATYTNGSWLTYGGAVYGVLATNSPYTWEATGGFPEDYLPGGHIIVLTRPGADGTDGEVGAGLTPWGNWVGNVDYPQFSLVRHEKREYYNITGSSSNQEPTTNSLVWSIFSEDGVDGADGAVAVITSNSIFTGIFDNQQQYLSNSVTYWPYVGYGQYVVLSDCSPPDYNTNGWVTPSGLENTNYFRKVAYFGQDGTDGTAGLKGDTGDQGADGAGNLWFDQEWDGGHSYANEGIVVIDDGATYVSKQASFNKKPISNTNDWYVASKAGVDGTDGSLYVFSLEWDDTYTYNQYDMVVVTNIFYMCRQDGVLGPGTEPWDNPLLWDVAISPQYRYYGTLSTREYSYSTVFTSNELVRYKDLITDKWSTYICIVDLASNVAPPDDDNKYSVIASAGDQGLIGETGPQGEDGIQTYVFTNADYITTNYFDITNHYTTDLAAAIYELASSNNVEIDEDDILIATFNTNYSRISNQPTIYSNPYTNSASYDHDSGEFTITFMTNYVVKTNNADIHAELLTYNHVTSEVGTIYVPLSNRYYMVEYINGTTLTNWRFEKPDITNGAIWKIDLKMGNTVTPDFGWFGDIDVSSVSNLPIPQPSSYSSFIFEIIQGSTNVYGYN